MLLYSFLYACITSCAIGSISDIIPQSTISKQYLKLTSCMNVLHDLHLSKWNDVIMATDSRRDSYHYSNEYLRQIHKVISNFDYTYLINHEALFERYRNVQNVVVVVLIGQQANSDLFNLIDMFRNRYIYLCFVFHNGANEKHYSKVLEHSADANLHSTIAVVNGKDEVFISKGTMKFLATCEFNFTVDTKPWNSFSQMEIKNLMSDRRELNFHKCPINVSTTLAEPFVMYDESKGRELTGLEVRLMKTIADVLNFTTNFIVRSHWGVLEMYKIRKGGLQIDVLNGSSEIGFATIWLDPWKIRLFDITSTYYVDCLTWSVPPFSAKRTIAERTIGVLMKGFKPWVWIFFVISILIIPIGLTACYKIYKTRESDSFSVFTIGLMIALSLVLQKPIPRTNVITRGTLSFLCVVWYMYTLIMNTIYCGFLSSNLLISKPQSSVKNIKEIVEAKMSLAMTSSISYSLMSVEDEIYGKLKKIGIEKLKTTDCLYDISDGKWMAFSRNKASLLYHRDKQWRERKGSLQIFSILDYCYMNYPVAFILR